MSEHSKIPLPETEHDSRVPEQDGTSAGDAGRPAPSLIERAAGRFDFNSYIGAPAPLPPMKAAAAKVAPVEPSAPAPAPEFAELPQAPVAAPARSQPLPEASKPPVPFTGAHHRVDRDLLREQGLIVPEGAVTALLEEFRIVKRQLMVQAADLRRQKAGAAAQRVLISSPHPGEGKTYCSVNLALSIAAEKESEVLLVDADFAKPSILSHAGPARRAGPDGRADGRDGSRSTDYVLGTDIPGLWVLPAGDTTSHDSEYLSSSRTARVLDRLTEGAPHRMVIFDSPPALAASPAAELGKVCRDRWWLSCGPTAPGRARSKTRSGLLDACPNVQLLLNAAQFSPSGRRFGTYYGYGDESELAEGRLARCRLQCWRAWRCRMAPWRSRFLPVRERSGGGDSAGAGSADDGGKLSASRADRRAAKGRQTGKRVEISPYIEVDQVVNAEFAPGDDVLTYTQAVAGVDASVSGRNNAASASVRYEHRFGWGKKASRWRFHQRHGARIHHDYAAA